MGKLKILSGKEACQILTKHGFLEIRRRGSHIVMQKRLHDSTITIPVPNHKKLRTGTLRAIIRQSEILRSEFEVD